jgi:hypothetical protein
MLLMALLTLAGHLLVGQPLVHGVLLHPLPLLARGGNGIGGS